MGTRKAVRQDLKDVIDFRNSDKFKGKWDAMPFKVYHTECQRGRVKSQNGTNLSCGKCKTSWGQTRTDTWTDAEIENKFWIETPIDSTVYKIVDKGGYFGLVPAPLAPAKVLEEPKAAELSWLDKALKSLGAKP